MDSDYSLLTSKYEEMLQSGQTYYFDVHEIEEIALAYEKQEDFDKGLEVILYGLSIHTDNTDLLIQKAKFTLFTGDYGATQELLKGLPQDNILVKLTTIELLFCLNRYEEGKKIIHQITHSEQFDACVADNINNIMCGYCSEEETKEFLLENYAVIKNHAGLLFDLAHYHSEEKAYRKALKCLYRITEIDPYNVEAWSELDGNHKKLNEHKESIEAIQNCIAITVSYEQEHQIRHLFKRYYQYSMVEQARKLLTDHPSIFENEANEMMRIANTYLLREKTRDAIIWMDRAQKICPSTDRLFRIALAHEDLGNIPAAKDCMIEVAANEPENADYHLYLGNLYQLMEQHSLAIEAYKTCHKLKPNNDNVMLTLGDALEKSDNIEEALFYYQELHKRLPFDVKISIRLLLSYYYVNNTEKALELTSELCRLIERSRQNDGNISDKDKCEILAASQAVDSLRELLTEMIDKRNKDRMLVEPTIKSIHIEANKLPIDKANSMDCENLIEFIESQKLK